MGFGVGGAFRRLLEARPISGLSTLRRRCAHAAPEPSPVVPNCGHRTCIAIANALVKVPMRPASKTFFEADVYISHTSECARRLGLACWSSSSWGTTTPRCLTSGPAPPMGAWWTGLSGAPAEAARPGACQALGRMITCYLMRARYGRCMDALGPRGERVSTVNRALERVFCRPCPLLVGVRSRWVQHVPFSRVPS